MKFIPDYEKRHLNGIYIIKNTIDSRVYIGECKNFYKRYGRHKSNLLNNKHCNIKLQNFVNTYGIDTLIFDILEVVDENRIDREIEYIKQYDSINSGFNIILDSRTMAHINNTMRKEGTSKLKGIKRDPEFCKKVSDGIKLYYQMHPNTTRTKWSKERKEDRKKYIAEHPERYKNRKPSTGNKTNHPCGENNPSAKINNDIARQIKIDIKNNVCREIILEKYNISANIYKGIKTGKTWKHIII